MKIPSDSEIRKEAFDSMRTMFYIPVPRDNKLIDKVISLKNQQQKLKISEVLRQAENKKKQQVERLKKEINKNFPKNKAEGMWLCSIIDQAFDMKGEEKIRYTRPRGRFRFRSGNRI